MRIEKVWLTSHKQERCWGPFESVPKAWAYLLGYDPTDPKRDREGTMAVDQHYAAGWTVNEVQLFPVELREP